jgi:hypothetical protein
VQRIAWLASALGLLVSCGGDAAAGSSEPGLFFPTNPEEQTAVMTALYQGPLVVREGCVLLGRPGDYSVAIWPKGFTADRDDTGRLVVRDERGDAVAIEGETFEMGGGYVAEFRPESKVEPRGDQISTVEQSLGYSLPERCLDAEVYGVWSVEETHPLA